MPPRTPAARTRAQREGEDYQAMKDAHALSAGRRGAQRPGEVSESLKTILDASGAAQKQRKYRNIPCEADGHRFDSQKERDRYWELQRLQERGAIFCLEVHPRFPLVVHGQDCGYYEGDFGYIERGVSVVEDVKSTATRKLPTYRLKRRLTWALYGIEIREI